MPAPNTATTPATYTGTPILKPVRSEATDGHLPDQDRRRFNGMAELQIRGDLLDIQQHLLQVSRNGDFRDGICKLSIFDPQSYGAAGIIAGDGVCGRAD